MTGSEDGIVRLWNSKDIYETNAGGDGPTTSQTSECTLHSEGEALICSNGTSKPFALLLKTSRIVDPLCACKASR